MLRFANAVVGAMLASCALVEGASVVTAAPSNDGIVKAEQYSLSLLDQPRFQAPPGWAWGHFKNADGANLRFGWTQATVAPRGTIIITPGFADTAEDFFEPAREFLAHGYDVWILDRRGQGGSERWLPGSEKAYSKGFDHDENDLVQFVTQIVRPRGPAFLVGESLGGHIGLRALHDHPDLVRAAAFSSPAIAIHTSPGGRDLPVWFVTLSARAAVVFGLGAHYGFNQHDWRFNPNVGGPNDIGDDDPVRAHASVAWFVKYPNLREGGATWAFVDALMRSSDLEQRPGWMSAIVTPVLIGETPKDALAVSSVMVDSCHAMKRCTLVEFLHTKHALFNDSDPTRARFMAAIFKFFELHASAKS